MSEAEISKSVYASLYNRRISKFSTRPVDEGIITSLISIASFKPKELHHSKAEFVLVTNDDIRRLVCSLVEEKKIFFDAPYLVAVLADTKLSIARSEETLEEMYKRDLLTESEFIEMREKLKNRMLPSIFGSVRRIIDIIRGLWRPQVTAVYDSKDAGAYARTEAAIGVGQLIAAAATENIATYCSMSFDERRMKRVLNVPARFEVMCVVAMGYPLTGVEVDAPSFPDPAVIHKDIWGS